MEDWKLKVKEAIETSFPIINKQSEEVPFRLNKAQMMFLENMTGRDTILKARQEGFCLEPSTKILTANLEWKKIKDISIGERLVAVDENIKGGRGCGRKLRTSIVEAKGEVFKEAIKLIMDDGRELIATPEHRFLSRSPGGEYIRWRKTKKLKVGNGIRYITTPWEKSTNEDYWVAGMIDGEAHLRQKTSGGIELCISQVAGKVYDRLIKYTKDNNLSCRLDWDIREVGEKSKLGSKPVGRIVFNRISEMFKLMGKTRPTKHIGWEWWNGMDLPGKRNGLAWSKIVKIELLPKQKMIDLQTSEKTFIAEGFVSHNSSLILALFTYDFLFKPNSISMSLSYETGASEKLLDKVKLYIKYLGVPMKYNSRNEMYNQAIGSTFYIGTAAAVTTGRGQTITNLHASEVAFYRDADTLMTGLLQSVPKDGRAILESTANGMGNYFHREWIRGVNGDGAFTPHFFSWKDHEEYKIPVDRTFKPSSEETQEMIEYGLSKEQVAWKREKVKEFKTIDEFNQEYPMCLSADTLVGFSDGGGLISQIPNNIYNGVAKTYLVRTSLGYSVRATLNHQFSVNGSFVPLGILPIGSEVDLQQINNFNKYQSVMVGELPIYKKELVINERLAEFIGIFMGDGSFYSHPSTGTLSVVCDATCPDFIKRTENIIESLFGRPTTREVGSKKGGREIRLSSNKLKDIFNQLDLLRLRPSDNRPLRHVHVPNYIKQSPLSVVAAFLSGIFETDGFTGYKTPRIVLFSKYQSFLEDIQRLLMMFGISSKINIADKKTKTHTYVGRELILRANEARLFANKIGFLSEKKNERIKNYKPISKTGRPCLLSTTDKIVFIGDEKEEPVFNITTPEHFYSANGLKTHNSPEVAFISSGNPVFDIKVLNRMKKDASKPKYTGNLVGTRTRLTLEQNTKGYLDIWELPLRTDQYVIGADVAEVKDYSVAQVIKKRTMEVVARFRARLPVDAFAKELERLGFFYNTALLGVERNNQGIAVLVVLNKLYYPNLFYREDTNDVGESSVSKLGWSTDIRTRPILITDMGMYIRNGDIKIHDEITLGELMTFVRTDEKPDGTAQPGCFDDCVMSLGIAIQMYRRFPESNSRNDYVTYAGSGYENQLDIKSSAFDMY